MLDSYHEEVRKKRNNHAIFWGVVFVFWILLFMFFQGYYFSISVWFEQLLHKNSQSEPKPPLNQILKSFGIVNLKVSPTPKIFTLNNEPYTNGDNKFVDYGEYELKVEEPGYIPLTLNINLSRNHAFYLNTIRLFKNPNEKIFERPTQKIEKLGAGFLSFESSGKIFQHPIYTSTGRLINSAMIRTSSWEIIKKNIEWEITSLGEGYFIYQNKVHLLNLEGILTEDETFRNITPCEEAKIVHGHIYCPKAKKFLTGKYKDLREKILEVNYQFIRTEFSLIRLWGSMFNSSTPLTSNANFTGESKLIAYEGRQVILNQNKLYDIENGFKEIKVEGFEGILQTEKFWDEVVTIWNKQNSLWVRVDDGKNSRTEALLKDFSGSNIAVYSFDGAYIIASENEVLLYYKWARSAFQLAKGEILAVIDKTILFNKDGQTYSISLEDSQK